MGLTSSHLTCLDFDSLDLAGPGSPGAGPFVAHLDACPACREQQKARQALADQFAREVLPRSLPAVRQRLAPRSRWRMGWWAFALSPVACGVLLAFLGLHKSTDHTLSVGKPVPGDLGDIGIDIGIKGGRDLLTYVRRGNKVTRLAPGGVVAAGDALRFVVETGSHRYLFIAGVDGGGRAHAYYPFGQWQSAAVAPHSRFEVPGSLVLDNAPGPERIFALVSSRPLDGDDVRPILEALARRGQQAIRTTAAPSVVEAEISSILFEKRE
jgi:hypothetical protein